MMVRQSIGILAHRIFLCMNGSAIQAKQLKARISHVLFHVLMEYAPIQPQINRVDKIKKYVAKSHPKFALANLVFNPIKIFHEIFNEKTLGIGNVVDCFIAMYQFNQLARLFFYLIYFPYSK